jgi:hypothetical protein
MNQSRLPKRSTILHVRSKDADLNGTLNTDINILLKAPITTAPTEVCVISVVSAEIPYSFYNISSNLGNNILHYDATSYDLGSSNYDINRLVSVLNTGLPLDVTWSKYTFKITFTNNTESSVTIKFSENPKLAQVLGFKPLNQTISVSGSISSDGIIDLATIHSVFIKSNISTGNVLSTRLGNSSILQKVSCDVNFGGIIYQDSDDHIQRTITTANIIDSINLKLTDQNNITLDMNGVNYELAILFSIYNQNVDSVPVERITRRDTVDISVDTPDIDDSHVIEDETEIEQLAKNTIGDHLLERLKANVE